MLTDDQVDELERLIIYASMDTLPLVLSRAIPVLFAELRTVRAAMDSRAQAFLEGFDVGHGRPSTDDSRGLSVGHDSLASGPEVLLGSEDGTQVSAGGAHSPEISPEENRPVRKRTRRKARGDTPELVGGGSVSKVGGEVPVPGGEPGILPIQAIE